LWNGDIKQSQDITVGDTLIGDDGTVRTVTKITNGRKQMYKVKQNNGIDYTVTKDHILSLRCGSHKSMFWNKTKQRWVVKWIDLTSMNLKSRFFDTEQEANDYKNSITDIDVIDCSVDDYIKFPKNVKDRLYGFKGSCVKWPSKKVIFDPYIMGLWLGDGNKDGSGFSCADLRIINSWQKWCLLNDAEIVHTGQYNYSIRRNGYKSNSRINVYGDTSVYSCKACISHKEVYNRAPSLACASIDEINRLLVGDETLEQYLTLGASKEQLADLNDRDLLMETLKLKIQLYPSKCGSVHTNPLRDAVKFYDLYNSKDIPINYIVNDETTRLEILAGFLDSDGCIQANNFIITQSGVNKNIINKLDYLCKSLGLHTKITKIPNGLKLYISGDTHRIPVRLGRKKAEPRKSHNKNGRKCADLSRTKIDVELLGEDEYYGWEVDGNNRFVLEDFTVVHNCNNQQFLNGNHWMNGMKEWDNVTIVDTIVPLEVDDKLFLFCPYVPNGRFEEALDTYEGDWKDASCIFAHQEFRGCKMGAIISIDGDNWKESYPHVISGHIHSRQKIQDNVYYPGSAMQHAFGESTKNIIAYVEFNEDRDYILDEVDLKLPRKRIVYKEVEDMEEYEPPAESKDKIKVTISGNYEQFKAFKKTKKYKNLIKKGAKIVFKPKKLKTDKAALPEVEQESDFRVILAKLINHEKDEYLFQVYEHMVNGKIISEDDVLFL
jgi:hypothetical protein